MTSNDHKITRDQAEDMFASLRRNLTAQDELDTDRTYTIRPTLEYATAGGEHGFTLEFRGGTLALFHDGEHAARTLAMLSILEFHDAGDHTLVTLDTTTGEVEICDAADQQHAVRDAARWAAANEQQRDYQTYEIPDVDDQDDSPATGTLRAV